MHLCCVSLTPLPAPVWQSCVWQGCSSFPWLVSPASTSYWWHEAGPPMSRYRQRFTLSCDAFCLDCFVCLFVFSLICIFFSLKRSSSQLSMSLCLDSLNLNPNIIREGCESFRIDSQHRASCANIEVNGDLTLARHILDVARNSLCLCEWFPVFTCHSVCWEGVSSRMLCNVRNGDPCYTYYHVLRLRFLPQAWLSAVGPAALSVFVLGVLGGVILFLCMCAFRGAKY